MSSWSSWSSSLYHHYCHQRKTQNIKYFYWYCYKLSSNCTGKGAAFSKKYNGIKVEIPLRYRARTSKGAENWLSSFDDVVSVKGWKTHTTHQIQQAFCNIQCKLVKAKKRKFTFVSRRNGFVRTIVFLFVIEKLNIKKLTTILPTTSTVVLGSMIKILCKSSLIIQVRCVYISGTFLCIHKNLLSHVQRKYSKKIVAYFVWVFVER